MRLRKHKVDTKVRRTPVRLLGGPLDGLVARLELGQPHATLPIVCGRRRGRYTADPLYNDAGELVGFAQGEAKWRPDP